MFHIHFQLKLCPTPQSLLIFYLITEKYGKRKQQNFWEEIIFIWKFSFDRTKYDEWPGRNFSRRRLPVRQKLELNFQLKTRKKLSQEWVICFLYWKHFELILVRWSYIGQHAIRLWQRDGINSLCSIPRLSAPSCHPLGKINTWEHSSLWDICDFHHIWPFWL